MSIAREDQDCNISPFTISAIETLLNTKDKQLAGSPRFVVKTCYMLLQRAAEELDASAQIDEEFVRNHMEGLLK